jgi:hypothetical protein
MRSQHLNKIFAGCYEDAQFHDWNKGRRPKLQFVYVCEYQTVWRFTPKEWWLFATKATRNNGSYDLPLSRALRSRPKQIVKGKDGKIYSPDDTIHCVNPLDWTLDDWKHELI